MRVLIVSGIYPPDPGGPATYLRDLTRSLADAGDTVAVITLADQPAEEWVEPGAVDVCRIARGLLAPERAAAVVAAVRERAGDADVAYVNGLFVEAATALCGTRCRRVAKVVGDWAWERAAVRGWFPPRIEEFQRARIPVRCRLLRAAHRRAIRSMDRVITPSRYLADLARGWDVPETRIAVIPNALTGDLEPPADAGPRESRLIVGVGRFVPWKRFADLIDVLPGIPDAALELIGDGPERDRLHARAADRGVSARVRFPGTLPRAEVARRLCAASVVALPSTYEGWPHVLVEAMAAGAPVVAARAGGTPELVRHDENGLLVDPGDLDGLRAAVGRVLDDPATAARLAARGRQTVDAWGWDDLFPRTRAVLGGADRCSVVMIGTNRSLLDPRPGDDTLRRLSAYASRCDGITAVVALPAPVAGAPADSEPAPGLRAVAVASRSRPLRYQRAARVAAALARDGAATVVQSQEPVFAGPAGAWAARRSRARWTVCAYGIDPWDPGYLACGLWERMLAPITRAVLRRADGIQVDTSAARDAFAARGIDPARVVVKPMIPDDLDRFAGLDRPGALARLGLAGDVPRLLWAGRPSRQKNLPLLRRLVAEVRSRAPDVEWLLAGPSGPSWDGLPGVRALGPVGRDRLRDAYAAADLVVVTSFYDGFARVLMEAGAAGLLVVTTPTFGAREVVADGVAGSVAALDDPGAFADRILAWITVPADQRAAAGFALGEAVAARLRGFDDMAVQQAAWRNVAPPDRARTGDR